MLFWKNPTLPHTRAKMLFRVALGPTLSASVFIVEGVVLCISEFNLLSWNEIAWGFERGGVGSPGCPSLREEWSQRLVLGGALAAPDFLPTPTYPWARWWIADKRTCSKGQVG